jgi:hypothetical protein
MDLKNIAREINEVVSDRRKEIELEFIENRHTYYMKDTNGVRRRNFPSVSKIMKKFYPPFDQQEMALKMCNGDFDKAKELINEWKELGRLSVNLGSRTHFLLEENIVKDYDNFKELRRPEFSCDEEQIVKSDNMVIAGKEYIDLMHKRGAVLIDTEMVLGDPELGYTGQGDNTWLMENKKKDGFGLVITDWKTNQPKNFVSQWYTKKMYKPFHLYDDTALGHYYIQIPLYGKLLLKMLENTKYKDIKFLGGVVVLLKDNATYEEFKVPQPIVNTVLNMDIKKYI